MVKENPLGKIMTVWYVAFVLVPKRQFPQISEPEDIRAGWVVGLEIGANICFLNQV
jgi:hypothetical protein